MVNSSRQVLTCPDSRLRANADPGGIRVQGPASQATDTQHRCERASRVPVG
jgi:hypothetical protein